MAVAQEVEFLGYRCTTPGCSGTLECDGYEQFLMRMKGKFAFGLEVLYEHGDRVADGGVPWHQFWRQTLAKYGYLVLLDGTHRRYVPSTIKPLKEVPRLQQQEHCGFFLFTAPTC